MFCRMLYRSPGAASESRFPATAAAAAPGGTCRRATTAVLSVATTALLLLTGSGRVWASPAAGETPSGAGAQPAAAELPCAPGARFDPDNFAYPTAINNPFLPLVPGTRFVLDGTTNDSGEPLDHQVVFTVTDLTKVINGVRTRVVVDRDLTDGALAEQELAFFAQDNAGNVWSMGEYPEEFEDGEFQGAPNTWIP